jgi:Zn-dependent protease
MDMGFIQKIILVLVPMLLCLSIHEYAHAASAWWLGDDTASRQGRMTLNPISHIDIFGTLLLPILFVVSNSSFFFGWAKPVPVNPVRFTRHFKGKRVTMATGMMITAAAGPASNLVFGFLSALALKASVTMGVTDGPIFTLLLRLLQINYILAIFNLLPLPPLDGSKVLAGILPRNITKHLDYLERNTFVAFIILIALLQTGVLSMVIGPVFGWLVSGTLTVVGLH